tara:strand:+ start:339 stop:1256 length:918 start_codon:yes stop_codon:yes gene_type:complete
VRRISGFLRNELYGSVIQPAVGVIRTHAASFIEKHTKVAIGLVATLLMGGTVTAAKTTEAFDIPVIAEAKTAAQAEERFVAIETSLEAIAEQITIVLARVDDVGGRVETEHPRVRSESLGRDCSGDRLPFVTFSDVHIKKAASETYAVEIVGQGAHRIRAETVTISGLKAPNVTVATTTAYTLSVTNNDTDGFTLLSTSGTTTQPVVTSTGTGLTYSTSTADHLVLKATTADCWIETLSLTDVEAEGGDVRIDGLVAGTLTISGSFIGDGDGAANPDLVIGSSVEVGAGGETATGNDAFAGVHVE